MKKKLELFKEDFALITCRNCGAVWETCNYEERGVILFLEFCPICSGMNSEDRQKD